MAISLNQLVCKLTSFTFYSEGRNSLFNNLRDVLRHLFPVSSEVRINTQKQSPTRLSVRHNKLVTGMFLIFYNPNTSIKRLLTSSVKRRIRDLNPDTTVAYSSITNFLLLPPIHNLLPNLHY